MRYEDIDMGPLVPLSEKRDDAPEWVRVELLPPVQEYIDRETGVRLTVLQDDGKGKKDIRIEWSEGSVEDNEKINAAIRRLMLKAGITPPESEAAHE